MKKILDPAFLIGLTLGVVSLLWLRSRTAQAQAGCITARNLNPSALRGDAAEGDWLSYRNTKNGLSFRYPPSMQVEERDPAKFGFDNVPDVIVDLRGNRLNSPNIIVMRFICARGQKTPEVAAAKARALLETHPEEDPTGRVSNGAIGSMQVDGHETIVSCGCGRAACQWSVLTLQPRECKIFPMVPGESHNDDLPPPHDGEFPLLSIINTVHFESATTGKHGAGTIWPSGVQLVDATILCSDLRTTRHGDRKGQHMDVCGGAWYWAVNDLAVDPNVTATNIGPGVATFGNHAGVVYVNNPTDPTHPGVRDLLQ